MNLKRVSNPSAVSTGKLFAACLFVFALTPIIWSQSTGGQQPKASISNDHLKLTLGNRVLLENSTDGFLSLRRVRYSRDGTHFAVIACGFECNDNVGFLFNADGSGKRKFTAQWDFILQDKVEWSADGNLLFYYRVNSSGAETPKTAPTAGWVEVTVATGGKAPATKRRLNPEANYAVFGVEDGDSLNVRQSPGAKANVIGNLAHDATGIRFAGKSHKIGNSIWAKINHQGLTGWVNQNFLYETSKEQ
ncbi:MAG: SH3 domain-containing protein [Acidobacteria bacterium]|nr:SH3 domain-containing protein [Acidobacteriota bacterium]